MRSSTVAIVARSSACVSGASAKRSSIRFAPSRRRSTEVLPPLAENGSTLANMSARKVRARSARSAIARARCACHNATDAEPDQAGQRDRGNGNGDAIAAHETSGDIAELAPGDRQWAMLEPARQVLAQLQHRGVAMRRFGRDCVRNDPARSPRN
jgi:hypothetical protein